MKTGICSSYRKIKFKPLVTVSNKSGKFYICGYGIDTLQRDFSENLHFVIIYIHFCINTRFSLFLHFIVLVLKYSSRNKRKFVIVGVEVHC
jgi:hypothetical protein